MTSFHVLYTLPSYFRKDFEVEESVERFSAYDKWTEFEYKFSLQFRTSGLGGKPDNPVAYFTFDDDRYAVLNFLPIFYCLVFCLISLKLISFIM